MLLYLWCCVGDVSLCICNTNCIRVFNIHVFNTNKDSGPGKQTWICFSTNKAHTHTFVHSDTKQETHTKRNAWLFPNASRNKSVKEQMKETIKTDNVLNFKSPVISPTVTWCHLSTPAGSQKLFSKAHSLCVMRWWGRWWKTFIVRKNNKSIKRKVMINNYNSKNLCPIAAHTTQMLFSRPRQNCSHTSGISVSQEWNNITMKYSVMMLNTNIFTLVKKSIYLKYFFNAKFSLNV